MVTYSAAPMTANAWSSPDIDIDNPRFSISVSWTWPTQGPWTRFRLVRTVRSPVARVEEGSVVLDTAFAEYDDYGLDGAPVFRDGERPGTSQPDPGEWVYYTAFVLDNYRVWNPAGFVYEISPVNSGWSTRLPNLLPGAATAIDQGLMHPPDQASDVVQFLQGPAAFLDMLVTKAEAAQYFWDPVKAPPQAVPHIAKSWGYPYNNVVGMGRSREALRALRYPTQGSLASVARIASAATGGEVAVEISNNLMLTVDDSSFENGTIATTHWTPTAGLTVKDLAQVPGAVVVPPNVKVRYCLYVSATGKYYCGAADPLSYGIPIQGWQYVRMGFYGQDVTEAFREGLLTQEERDEVEGLANLTSAVDMGMDVYDRYGVLLQTFSNVVPASTLTSNWKAYGFSDPNNLNDYGNRVPLTIIAEMMPSNVLTLASNWTAVTSTGYSTPQSTTPVAQAGPPVSMKLSWNTAPSTDTTQAAWSVASAKFASTVRVGAVYVIDVKVTAATGAAQWRATIPGLAVGNTVIPDGTPGISTITWTATTTTPSFGVEVLRPGAAGTWGSVGTHNVERISVLRQDAEAIYGVPWFNTTNPCYLDLFVVDDGR